MSPFDLLLAMLGTLALAIAYHVGAVRGHQLGRRPDPGHVMVDARRYGEYWEWEQLGKLIGRSKHGMTGDVCRAVRDEIATLKRERDAAEAQVKALAADVDELETRAAGLETLNGRQARTIADLKGWEQISRAPKMPW